MRFLNSSFALLTIFLAVTAVAQTQTPSQPKAPATQAQPRAAQAPEQNLVPDDGIYLRHTDGANLCASIMSYNFSPGDNPQLESVTTCTPTNTQATKRARVPRPAPSGPQLRQTVLSDQR